MPIRHRSRVTTWSLVACIAALLGILLLGTQSRSSAASPVSAATRHSIANGPVGEITVERSAKKELSIPKAVVLGVVEGVTEFLPISSTGHLLVAEKLMNIGQGVTKEATDSYTVIIQLGAILAVLVVSWRRVQSILMGIIGKSAEGRKLLIALIAAFVPTVIIALALKKTIEKHFLKVPVVAAAWIVGGIVMLALGSRYRNARTGGKPLEALTPQHAVIIGVAQTLAVVWPGTSRSLVTILAAVVLGYGLSAAVEFSFLLGLATLGAASLKSIKDDGKLVIDTFGSVSPLIGIAVAFVSAAIAVKWMIGYLNKNDLTVFAGYRIAIGAATLIAMGLTSTL